MFLGRGKAAYNLYSCVRLSSKHEICRICTDCTYLSFANFPVAMRFGVTPVPIPNTTVKTKAAESTILATVWEDRWLPEPKKIKRGFKRVDFLVVLASTMCESRTSADTLRRRSYSRNTSASWWLPKQSELIVPWKPNTEMKDLLIRDNPRLTTIKNRHRRSRINNDREIKNTSYKYNAI